MRHSTDGQLAELVYNWQARALHRLSNLVLNPHASSPFPQNDREREVRHATERLVAVQVQLGGTQERLRQLATETGGSADLLPVSDAEAQVRYVSGHEGGVKPLPTAELRSQSSTHCNSLSAEHSHPVHIMCLLSLHVGVPLRRQSST